MRTFRRICVYCGSTAGRDVRYLEAARATGAFLAGRGLDVVYGGGRVGMMGAVADGALAAGGRVIGVIPEKLRDKELAHAGLSELYVVDSMHARKTMMAAMSDGFWGLPGGFGTLEEVFEVTTWSQLNYHKKPVGLLNINGYFDKLIEFLNHASSEGFVRPVHRPLIQSAKAPEVLLDLMAHVDIPEMGRWIDKP